MSLPVGFDPIAQRELAAATEHYQSISLELADRFLAQVDVVIDRLSHYPTRYPRVGETTRKISV